MAYAIKQRKNDPLSVTLSETTFFEPQHLTRAEIDHHETTLLRMRMDNDERRQLNEVAGYSAYPVIHEDVYRVLSTLNKTEAQRRNGLEAI